MRARLLSYQSFSDLYLKNHRIMSWHSARFTRGSDDPPKGSQPSNMGHPQGIFRGDSKNTKIHKEIQSEAEEGPGGAG
jgi:hypothetical protein